MGMKGKVSSRREGGEKERKHIWKQTSQAARQLSKQCLVRKIINGQVEKKLFDVIMFWRKYIGNRQTHILYIV